MTEKPEHTDEEVAALLGEIADIALDLAGGDIEEAARLIRFHGLGIMPWTSKGLAGEEEG